MNVARSSSSSSPPSAPNRRMTDGIGQRLGSRRAARPSGQRAWHVPGQAAAGDVGDAVDVEAGRSQPRPARPARPARRSASGSARSRRASPSPRAARRPRTPRPRRRPAIAATAPGTARRGRRSHWARSARTSEKPFEWSPDDGQADDRVARPDRRAVDDVGALDDADAAPRQVELVGSISPGCSAVSPPIRAHPASRQPAATEPTSSRDPLGHDLPDRDVVEERERLGAAAHDVVGAHRDEVDADRVEAPERGGDRGLRADAVGRGHEQRLAVAGRDADRAAEAAEPADDLGPTGRLDVRAASGRRRARRPRRRRRPPGRRRGPARPSSRSSRIEPRRPAPRA